MSQRSQNSEELDGLGETRGLLQVRLAYFVFLNFLSQNLPLLSTIREEGRGVGFEYSKYSLMVSKY